MKNIIKREWKKQKTSQKKKAKPLLAKKSQANRINYIQTMKNYNRISFSTYQLAESVKSKNVAHSNESNMKRALVGESERA